MDINWVEFTMLGVLLIFLALTAYIIFKGED